MSYIVLLLADAVAPPMRPMTHTDGWQCTNRDHGPAPWSYEVACQVQAYLTDTFGDNRYEVRPVALVERVPYVNPDCPFDCESEHWLASYGSTTTCPNTELLYGRCFDCGGFVPEDHGQDINYEFACDTCARQYGECSSCSNMVRGLRNDTVCDLCEYDNVDGCNCEDCREARGEDYDGRTGALSSVCRTCDTPNDWFMELTEEFVCRHVAEERMTAGQPCTTPEAALLLGVHDA